jgi:hypothetical protein
MILVAIDEVEGCRDVLEHAQRLSADDDGRVCVLHVCDTGDADAIGEVAFRSRAGFQSVAGDPVEQILRASQHPAVHSVVLRSRVVDVTRRGRVVRALSVRLTKQLLVVSSDSNELDEPVRDRVGAPVR